MNLVKAKTTKRFGGEPYITLPRGAKVGSTASESNVFKNIIYGFKLLPKDVNTSTDLVSVEEFKKDALVKFYSKDEEGGEFPYEFNVYGYNTTHEGANTFISVIELPDHNGLNLVGIARLDNNGNITINVFSATSEEGTFPDISETPNVLYYFHGILSNGDITDYNESCIATIQNPFTPGIDGDSRRLYELFIEFVISGIQSGTIFPKDPGPKEPELG